MNPSVRFNEKKWQADNDAHTLAQAEEIKADQKRMNAAAKAAQSMVDESVKKTNNLKKIARK
jgi:hypothetical protein